MGKRGRPRHPDILTPREWEVLGLLREGLTNEQIAERLGVSFATARYHVSEILSKLGVGTREEAARWEPEGERRGWWRALAPLTLAKAVGVAAAVAVLVGLGVLAWGVLRDGGSADLEDERGAAVSAGSPTSSSSPTPSPSPSPTSEEAAVDYVMEQLVNANGGTRPKPSPEIFGITAQHMLYSEASLVAQQHGSGGLRIQPDDYYCPGPWGCPYPGEPADQPGWLIIVEELGEFAPTADVTRMIAWVGDGG